MRCKRRVFLVGLKNLVSSLASEDDGAKVDEHSNTHGIYE